MSRQSLVGVSLLSLLLVAATPSERAQYASEASGSGISIAGRDKSPDGSGIARGPLLVAARGPVIQYVYSYVPACDGNTPGGGAIDNLCAVASRGCPQGLLRYWGYRSVATAEPRVWNRTGQTCMAPGAVGVDGAELAIGFTVEDFRRLPLPPATSVVEPPGGDVLINIETNAYATAAPTTIPTEVLGQPVTVRATPIAYTWDFGDGGSVGPTSDPGAPYPSLRNAHAYTVPGDYAITLTTTYAGEFSVAGGPYLPIDGTAEVASPAQAVTAHSATSELVAAALP